MLPKPLSIPEIPERFAFLVGHSYSSFRRIDQGPKQDLGDGLIDEYPDKSLRRYQRGLSCMWRLRRCTPTACEATAVPHRLQTRIRYDREYLKSSSCDKRGLLDETKGKSRGSTQFRVLLAVLSVHAVHNRDRTQLIDLRSPILVLVGELQVR